MQAQHKAKRLAALFVLATTTLLSGIPVFAAYPDRVIKIIVPFAPGGGTDAIARVLAQEMAKDLGASIMIENKPGAGTIIGAQAVAAAEADGYTLLMGSFAHAVNPSLNARLPFDPNKDFAPVALVARSPNIVVVNPKSSFRSVADLIAAAKAEPEKISYGTFGTGTSAHLAGEMFKHMAKVNMTMVPYKGSAPAITDTIGGQTQVMFPSLFTAMPYVKAGKLKAVGVAGTKRSALMPDVPTLQEQGIADVDVSQWYGIFAPAKTPKPVIEQLNKVLNEVLADKSVIKRLEDHGAEVSTMTTDQMRTYVAQEQVKWKKVVQAAKITAD